MNKEGVVRLAWNPARYITEAKVRLAAKKSLM